MPKSKKQRFYHHCRALHLWLLVMAALAVLFHLLKSNRAAMNFWVDHISTPIKYAMTTFTGLFRFSVGEWLVYLCVVLSVAWLVRSVAYLVKSKNKANFAYRLLLKILCAVMAVYTSFNLMWGVNYYTDTFQDKSGILASPVGKQQLHDTTVYFIDKLNAASALVPRDSDGYFAADSSTIFEQSAGLYRNTIAVFPFLKGKDSAVKPLTFSEILSYMDTTGFYFPFTAEANVNAHSPLCLTPSTIAHEIAHQRNISSEQEANFVAIVACDLSGIPEYAYSGYLLAYIHLSNALYKADPQLWQQVVANVNEDARRDLNDYSTYWKKYETPVAQTAREMNDSRLKSYGQTLGTQSYGAVVDLLVAYYTR